MGRKSGIGRDGTAIESGIGVGMVMRRWMSLRLFCWEVGREVKFRVGSCRFWTRGGFGRGDRCSDAVRESP